MLLRHDRIAALTLTAAMIGLQTTAAHAVLPPYWQSAAEISAIVNDKSVHDAIKYEEPILSIGNTGDKVYEIKTPRCSLSVTIVEKPRSEGVGPSQFDIQVGNADCQ
jgi:hypothetical protein